MYVMLYYIIKFNRCFYMGKVTEISGPSTKPSYYDQGIQGLHPSQAIIMSKAYWIFIQVMLLEMVDVLILV